jgi:hypothetical protein
MARTNTPFLSFNRGLLSPKAIARVDLDRTRLSAEVYTNWLPKTQGAMTIRPGTKYMGSSRNDTGAEFIEFVASTDDVALCELTHQKMRIWLGDDAHELALLGRPAVATTVSLSDTGWSDASTGGTASVSSIDAIPAMTATTTSGVTITASSAEFPAWQIADNDLSTAWRATSAPATLVVDFGAGNSQSFLSYSLRAPAGGSQLDNMASAWALEGNDVDTGNGWTIEDTQGSETGWSHGERRNYTITDTGTPGPWRYWRLRVTALNGDNEPQISEFELFRPVVNTKTTFSDVGLTLNATALGALARVRKRVVVDTGDVDVEHSLAIDVTRGPVTLRVGSSVGDDDYVSETTLGTGYHNLAFTPESNFHITLQTDAIVNRIVSSLEMGDSGTVEITAPWDAADLENIRYDQSADVVYVDCDGVRPSKIERRGTGRSWSVVDYAPANGPFLTAASSRAKMKPSHFYGNIDITSDVPFFSPGHVGALIRMFHEGQSGQWRLGAAGAKTDAVKVTGISDTGTPGPFNERRVTIAVTGTWSGRIILERSIDGDDLGFKPITDKLGAGNASDTGTFSRTIDDHDDNLTVWYRARIGDTGTGSDGYTSGVAVVDITYPGGGITGTARITAYNSNTNVDAEVISRFSDTGLTDNWQEGYWSDARSFPTAVALHGGRLAHANGGNLFMSVADDYENFDSATVGDAGPLVRTLGSGPVDSIHYLVSLLRMIIGTAGAELALTSSSLDEPVTPSNSNARGFSTQGSANLRTVKMDTRAIMVQRSRQRVFMVGPGGQGSSFGDYEAFELTLLVPDLLAAGVVSIAVQRQPDTRIHCVLADGRVGILTYEPQEEVICWSKWQGDTGTGAAVEKAMVLPGVSEDAVFYHVRRTINGATRRYLEKWAMESECTGDTGLSWIMDCAKSYTDTGRSAIITGYAHLAGERVVVWADDTGQALAGKDLSPDVNGVQTLYTVDTGSGTVVVYEDIVPTMTAATTNGVTISASSENASNNGESWRAFDDSLATAWEDTGDYNGVSSLPSWVKVDFGAGNALAAAAYAIRASSSSLALDNAPRSWNFQGNDVDTGSEASWTTLDTGGDQTGWAVSERRVFTVGAPAAYRFYRLLVNEIAGGGDNTIDLTIGEIELFARAADGVTLSEAVHHAVAGLPYKADWKSTKLAYAAEAGTALAQMKRSDKIGFVLHETHNNGLFFGSDSGNLDPLPRSVDGAVVDADKIHGHFDKAAMPFPGLWDTDSRIHLRAKAPRPVTVLAAVPTVQTNEKV